ncbi:hypothetical protein [Nesterenkonia jeotgali]|uniref:Uncharacterized protein n=1 Tax=Nesterenkonia jeotgali TaxID=317018 RepID=A0A839FKX4_9MICC|nr:hypothetical protein [Nesterenkonia jeotgali]MBA8920075.1 hypothetical protein [Nesterenkonia jeotgali]
MRYFAHNNNAQLSDLDFFKSLGIRQERPRGETTYIRDQNTGRMLQHLGYVFVRTDGIVQFRSRGDTEEAGVRVLVKTAVDCIEDDLHKQGGWVYKRKTAKFPGYWAAAIYAVLDPSDAVSQEIAILKTAMADLSRATDFGIATHELQPTRGDAQ